MKTNFSSKTVEGSVCFTFEDMALMTDVFETATLEAVENSDTQKTLRLCEIAERLGFSVDIDAPDFTQSQAGQDSGETA